MYRLADNCDSIKLIQPWHQQGRSVTQSNPGIIKRELNLLTCEIILLTVVNLMSWEPICCSIRWPGHSQWRRKNIDCFHYKTQMGNQECVLNYFNILSMRYPS